MPFRKVTARHTIIEMKCCRNTIGSIFQFPVLLAAAFYLLFCLLTTGSHAQTPGNYPNKIIMAGLNTAVVPAAAPSGASSVVAFTHTNCKSICDLVKMDCHSFPNIKKK